MSEAKKKKSMYAVHFAIMVMIPVVMGLLPAPAPITPYGMKVVGVFASLIYGWTFINLLIPSLFAAVAMALVGYGTVDQVFVAMFTNTTVLMMMFGVLCFGAIEQTGAGDWVAAKLLGSKLAKKSPIMVIEIFFFVFWIGQQIGLVWFIYFAMMPLMYKMLMKCGYEKGSKFNALFLCGCLMMMQTSMSLFSYRGWGLMTAGTAQALTQVAFNQNAFTFLTMALTAVMMLTYPIFMKLCGCDFSKLANVDVAEAFGKSGDEKITKAQGLALGSVVVFVVVVILAGLIPALAWFNTNVGVLGMMILLWLFVVCYKVDGKPLMDMRKAAAGFQWDMVMLIAIALLVSNALTSEATGVSPFVAGILVPMFSGTHPLVFLMVLGLVTCVLTNFSNNIAICFVMLNIVCSMYNNGFPVNITAAAFVISITSVAVAYLTPAASMPGALMHAAECNTASSLYKMVPLQMIYSIFALAVVIVPYVLFFA